MLALNVMKKRIVEGCGGPSGGWFHWGKKWRVSGMDPFLKRLPFWRKRYHATEAVHTGNTWECQQKPLLLLYTWKYMQQARNLFAFPWGPKHLGDYMEVLTVIGVSWTAGTLCDCSWRDLLDPTSEKNTLKRRRDPGENWDNISLRSKVHKQSEMWWYWGLSPCPISAKFLGIRGSFWKGHKLDQAWRKTPTVRKDG